MRRHARIGLSRVADGQWMGARHAEVGDYSGRRWCGQVPGSFMKASAWGQVRNGVGSWRWRRVACSHLGSVGSTRLRSFVVEVLPKGDAAFPSVLVQTGDGGLVARPRLPRRPRVAAMPRPRVGLQAQRPSLQTGAVALVSVGLAPAGDGREAPESRIVWLPSRLVPEKVPPQL